MENERLTEEEIRVANKAMDVLDSLTNSHEDCQYILIRNKADVDCHSVRVSCKSPLILNAISTLIKKYCINEPMIMLGVLSIIKEVVENGGQNLAQ